MTYSCTDFVDSILDALGVVVPDEDLDNPSAQADLALDVIAELKAAAKQPGYPGYVVICGNDTTANFRDAIVFATHQVFPTYIEAARHADGISRSRRPEIVRIEKALRGA